MGAHDVHDQVGMMWGAHDVHDQVGMMWVHMMFMTR